MIVGPYKRPHRNFKPVALVTPGHGTVRLETEWGATVAKGPVRTERLLEQHADHVLYCNGSLNQLQMVSDARHWQGFSWGGRMTKMELIGTKVKVISLRGSLEDSEDPFRDLYTVISWVNSHGGQASTVSSMAWSLWRSSLDKDYEIGSNYTKTIGRASMFGGRQGTAHPEPHSYSNMVAADIVSAYPWSMAARPYPLGLRKVSPATELAHDANGFVRASARIPDDMPFGPLPQRISNDTIMFPTGGYLDGYWTWAEALAARELGCDVEVSECYAPIMEVDLFRAWYDIAQEGKRLPGAASQLAKGIANTLWGQFAMRDDQQETVLWHDPTGLHELRVPLPGKSLPHVHAAHLAAETSSRVRVRMLTEGCYGTDRTGPGGPVHIDTDGMIIRASAVRGWPMTGEPGEWVIKTRMRKVEIRAPQVLRYLCGQGCGISHTKWHYSVTGVPAGDAEYLFDEIGHGGLSFNPYSIETVLPAMHAQEYTLTSWLRAQKITYMEEKEHYANA